jgi:GTP-binding protein
MIVDDITIHIQAGHGGRGKVAFNKNLMSLGPTGGSGGKGGDIYCQGVADLGALNQLRFKKVFAAENGENGNGQNRDGHTGEDLIIHVPVGTVIHDLSSSETREITKIGEKILLANGGLGGKGNFLFRSPKSTSPTRFQPGLPGESGDIRLELKLIADIGFIGLPNIGKSSLINELTRAKSTVANYAFTTLEPHLGAYYNLILADIPGLIEGASTGKGLGIKFLRHIERTKYLFHFIAADSPHPIADYSIIRKELGAFQKSLLKKPEYIIISRTDTVTPQALKKIIASCKKKNPKVLPISIYDFDSIEKLKKVLTKLSDQK